MKEKNKKLENGVEKEQIILIKLEEPNFEELMNRKKLYKNINERLVERKMTYFFR